MFCLFTSSSLRPFERRCLQNRQSVQACSGPIQGGLLPNPPRHCAEAALVLRPVDRKATPGDMQALLDTAQVIGLPRTPNSLPVTPHTPTPFLGQ